MDSPVKYFVVDLVLHLDSPKLPVRISRQEIRLQSSIRRLKWSNMAPRHHVIRIRLANRMPSIAAQCGYRPCAGSGSRLTHEADAPVVAVEVQRAM